MRALAGKDKTLFLNQARASAWLIRITLSTDVGMHVCVCVCVCLCVCVRPEAINN